MLAIEKKGGYFFLARKYRYVFVIWLLSLATFAYGQSQKSPVSGDVKLSLYVVTHQQYATTSRKDQNGIVSAYVDAKTQTGPIIALDPIVIGNVEDHPGKTVLQKIGNDQIMLRVSGSVFDILADGISDGAANVQRVHLNVKSSLGRANSHMAVQAVQLEEQETIAPHPYLDTFEEDPAYFQPLRPFPYAGRFESEPVLIEDLVDIDIGLWAVGVLDTSGHASIEVEIENETHDDFDIRAAIEEPYPGDFYYEPMLLHISDSSVTEHNVTDQKALVNGVEVGLIILNGQLQLDRPLFASYKKPNQVIPNLIQVPGEPDAIYVEYKGETLRAVWGYTSNK